MCMDNCSIWMSTSFALCVPIWDSQIMARGDRERKVWPALIETDWAQPLVNLLLLDSLLLALFFFISFFHAFTCLPLCSKVNTSWVNSRISAYAIDGPQPNQQQQINWHQMDGREKWKAKKANRKMEDSKQILEKYKTVLVGGKWCFFLEESAVSCTENESL